VLLELDELLAAFSFAGDTLTLTFTGFTGFIGIADPYVLLEEDEIPFDELLEEDELLDSELLEEDDELEAPAGGGANEAN
jgi:hypothetical protein